MRPLRQITDDEAELREIGPTSENSSVAAQHAIIYRVLVYDCSIGERPQIEFGQIEARHRLCHEHTDNLFNGSTQ